MTYKATYTPEYYKATQTAEYYKASVVFDEVAPTLLTAVVPAAGTSIVLTFDETLDDNTLFAGNFDILGVSAASSSVVASGTTVTVGLTGTIYMGDSVGISYTKSTGNIRDPYLNEVANFQKNPGQVTNNSAAFAPTSLSTLEFWIDADSSFNVIGSEIDSMHDLSDNHYNIVANNASERATYDATGLNGKPCAIFDPLGSDYLLGSTIGGYFNVADAFTIAGIISITSTGDQGIFTIVNSSSDRFQISIVSGGLHFALYNTSWKGITVAGISTGIHYFVYQQYEGTQNPRLWLDGVEKLNPGFVSNGTSPTSATYVLGSIRETSVFKEFDGKLRELFFCSSYLSSTDINRINSYLNGNS